MINLKSTNKKNAIANIISHAKKRGITTYKELHFLVIERCLVYRIKRKDVLKVIYTCCKNKLTKQGIKLLRVTSATFKSTYEKVRFYMQKPIIEKTIAKLEKLGDFDVLEFLRSKVKNDTFWGLYYLKRYYGLDIGWSWFRDVFSHNKVIMKGG